MTRRAPTRSASRARLRPVHAAVPGRIRVRHTLLRGNPALAAAVAARLLREAGVTTAAANPLTGSLLVHYGAPATQTALCRTIEDLLAGGPFLVEPEAAPLHSLSSAALDYPHEASGEPIWHTMPAEAVLQHFASSRNSGLSVKQAQQRLADTGPNTLARAEPRSAAAIFLDQLTSLPIALLSASAALSVFSGGLADAIAIMAAVLLNSGIATVTEKGAERTILGMSRYEPEPVAVLRSAKRILIDPAELVPGDVILIERGALMPADARLIEASEITINESVLTGESLPVTKAADALLPHDAPLAERLTMLFRGTAVTGGHGAAVVVATGQQTEIGHIQSLLGTVRPPETPIERQLGEVGRELVIINGAICVAIFGLGVLRGQGFIPMLRSAISLAVAAIPEGLPAVATTTLALGIRDLGKRDVLVRKLEAVETLGAVEVVGLDKTGTLTANRMATVAFHYDDETVSFSSGRIGPEGGRAHDPRLMQLLEAAVLSSEATVAEGPKGPTPVGSATESALLQAALDVGLDIEALHKRHRRLQIIPRSEARKRMTSLHAEAGGGRLLCVKGDPLEVLARCTARLSENGVVPLDETMRETIHRANDRMASRALRVLGVAKSSNGGDPQNERDLVWLGLAGLADPLRPGVKEAIHTLHGAGIRTVMITGDQSITAAAIARELDLGDGGDIRILEAGQISDVKPEVLAALAPQAQVFARISPANKLQIVRALQARGQIVAMTGDGINDGPALRAADIGVAMGGAGSDVAREVADIVLRNDELQGVIEAVRLGRATYANIRKVLRYLIGTNASETMVMLGGALAGWPAPLSPMQLLWLNLVSDALPALALGLEPPEPDVLEQPPHDPRAPILGRKDFRRLLREGAVLGVGGFAAYLLSGGANAMTNSSGSTIAFHGITLAQLLHAFACRSETHGLLEELNRPANTKLIGAVGFGLGLQVAAQTIPPLRQMLRLTPLGPGGLAAIFAAATGPLVVNEILTAMLRREDHLPDL